MSATGRELPFNHVRNRPIADIISVGENSPIAVVEGSDASGHPVTTDKFDVSKMVAMTTHRGTAGKKLYAVRDVKRHFKDIQTYEPARRVDHTALATA